jgi:hypothetical protein
LHGSDLAAEVVTEGATHAGERAESGALERLGEELGTEQPVECAEPGVAPEARSGNRVRERRRALALTIAGAS